MLLQNKHKLFLQIVFLLLKDKSNIQNAPGGVFGDVDDGGQLG